MYLQIKTILIELKLIFGNIDIYGGGTTNHLVALRSEARSETARTAGLGAETSICVFNGFSKLQISSQLFDEPQDSEQHP